MRVSVRFLPALLALVSAMPAAAQKSGNDFSIGVRFGTLGIGPEVSKLITPHIGLSAGAAFMSYSTTKTSSDVSFDADLKMKGFWGILNLYPGATGSFHLSGGIMTNPITVEGTGVPTGSTFEINKHTYTAAQVGTLSAKGEWSSALPYFGLGWGRPAGHGLSFVFDLGAAIGKPKVTLSSTSSDATIKNDVAAQQDTMQTKANKLPVYPVIQFGLVWRF